MIKKLLLMCILSSQILFAQDLRFGEAKGLFMSVGVGPRIPLADFADSHNLGAGFNINFSYTDNLVLPIFITGELGYQHLPGKQNFYKSSNYSSISTNLLTMSLGARHYYKPLVENIVLLMPVIEAGLSVGYFETSHQFKLDAGVDNYVNENVKVGFNVGVGVSMFLLDVLVYYNYFDSRQFLSADLRVRIPVLVTF